ncbi:hypothetical protein GEMRC1_004362 [Eukaryota sp. GEM-RC1]
MDYAESERVSAIPSLFLTTQSLPFQMNLLVGYLILMVSIVFEVFGTFFLRLSEGFKNYLQSALSLTCFIISLFLSSQALEVIPLTVFYAIWSSVGTVLTAIVGRFYFLENFGYPKLIGLILIVFGVVFMNIDLEDVKTNDTSSLLEETNLV